MTSSDSKPPAFLFATVGLKKGSGGIAELSRQVFRTLLDMHRSNQINLELKVLEDPGPQTNDELFKQKDLPPIRWFAGNRWKFALSLAFAKSDIQLLDHVGLGRLPGLIPGPLRHRYIMLIHGLEIWDESRSDYHRTASRADLWIANSQYTATKARRAHYPDHAKIKVCHPGKDIDVEGRHAGEAENREQGSLPQSAPGQFPEIGPHAMLIVGRLSAEQKHKGHDHLIEAMPMILESVPNAQLIICGEGNDLPRLQQKARDLDVAENIIFTGWVEEEELQQLYEHCALFVMPSDGDGFGLVFLEAMANGLPCVGLKSSAAEEIIEAESTGILVNRDDRDDMAERISSLLQDDIRRKKMGDASYNRYCKQFQGQHHTQRLQSILSDHLANPL